MLFNKYEGFFALTVEYFCNCPICGTYCGGDIINKREWGILAFELVYGWVKDTAYMR